MEPTNGLCNACNYRPIPAGGLSDGALLPSPRLMNILFLEFPPSTSTSFASSTVLHIAIKDVLPVRISLSLVWLGRNELIY